MKLYSFRYSPNPLKVRLALAEIGKSFETVEVVLFKGEQKTEEFLKINPRGKVPVLEDGDLRLNESNAILAYLGREYGGAFWPRSIAHENLALQWLFFEATALTPYSGFVWWTEKVAPKVQRPGYDQALVAEAYESLETAYDVLENHLKDNEYVLGDQYSLVDCSIGVTLSMTRGTKLDDPVRWPRIAAYVARIQARPSWSHAEGDLILNFG